MHKAYKIIKCFSSTTRLPVGSYNFYIREKKFLLTKNKSLPLLGASESHVNPIKSINSKKNNIKETNRSTEKEFDELKRINSFVI